MISSDEFTLVLRGWKENSTALAVDAKLADCWFRGYGRIEKVDSGGAALRFGGDNWNFDFFTAGFVFDYAEPDAMRVAREDRIGGDVEYGACVVAVDPRAGTRVLLMEIKEAAAAT